jgi:regulator of nucleoside diphosphate kinase
MERGNIILSSLDAKRIRQYIEEAKQKGTLNDFTIQRLVYEINMAEIREPDKIPNNIVTMNSEINFSFINLKKQGKIKIVYPNEADVKKGRISIFSPIANVLLGHKEGDIIEWIGPMGEMNIQIEKIVYQPEAAGHFDL